MKIPEIIFSGIEQTDLDKSKFSDDSLTLLNSYQVGQTRDKSDRQRIKFEEDQVVEFIFDDNTTWIANPDTIDDLFPEMLTAVKRSSEGAFELPVEISGGSVDRSKTTKLLLKVINVFAKKLVIGGVEKLAERLEDKQLGSKTGLFALGPEFQLQEFVADKSALPYLLLIHGVASSITGSFGGIHDTNLMTYIRKNYDKRVIAFQHRTLTHNPLQNVLELVKALPSKCDLHLITTSRGGLVGELLSRFCNSQGVSGFSSNEISILHSGYSITYFGKIQKLIEEIGKEIAKKKIVIEKFIRIACPAGGTTLASNRLDFFFNVTMNLLGVATGQIANPFYSVFRNLTAAVIACKNKPEVLPGMEVLNPESPFIKAINYTSDSDNPDETLVINNSLVVISGNATPAFNLNPIRFIARKLFFPHKNDLMVDTRYMVMGTRRSGKVFQYLLEDTEINHFRYFSCRPTSQAILRALQTEWGKKILGFSESVIFESPKYREYDLSIMGLDLSIPGIDLESDLYQEQPLISVSVSHGDLFYAKFPVLAGHFENDGILFGEKAVDDNLNSALTQRHSLGIYPGAIGTSEVFINYQTGFKGAVIIGLGKPESLTGPELSKSVAMGVSNYLLYLISKGNCGEITDSLIEDKGISSLIIGSNYGGLSVENSIKAIVQGVHTANANIQGLGLENPPAVRHIEFVDLYEDIAVNAFYSLIRIEDQEARSAGILMEAKKINTLLGSRKRIPNAISSVWWNRITVRKKISSEYPNSVECLKFSTSTSSAHEKETELLTNPALIDGAIREMSTNNRWSHDSAKAIFELIIPNDFKEQLRRHGNINWILDYDTAGYPWELLQDNVTGSKPLCVSAGMIRQLATDKVRQVIKSSPLNNALVIADPDLKDSASQLPGALKEGKMVSDLFTINGIKTVASFQGDPTEIIENLFSKDYRIIHLSGHGEFHEDNPTGSGMVIGNNMFLSTREIKQMSTVPELVFVNCCHIGKISGAAEELYQNRYKLAANIGTQLIENGVRCVVAAGWVVNDNAALEFAEVFYKRMFSGYSFGDAVLAARKAVFEKYENINTWGAYQCYGDPFYTFKQIRRGPEQQKKDYVLAQEAEIDLANLLSQIEIGKGLTEDYIYNLKSIQEKVDSAKVRTPSITEKEALIYFELRDFTSACSKFESLLKMEDAAFSFSVTEKYYNAEAKLIVSEFKETLNSGISEQERNNYLDRIGKVISHLDGLIKLSPTSRNYNILGSSYKRKALISIQSKKDDYIRAAGFYHQGYKNIPNWYSLTNWLSLEIILVLDKIHKWNKKVAENGMVPEYELPAYDKALKLLDSTWENHCKTSERMSYWDMIAGINIGLCKYLLQFSSKSDRIGLGNIFNETSELWKIAGSKGKRFAEIEHLEFLIDALDIKENTTTGILKANLEKLKNELSSLLNG